MVKKRTISMQDDLVKHSEETADKFYGGNFSMFITYLVSCHKNNLKADNMEAMKDIEPMEPKHDDVDFMDNIASQIK